MNRFADGLVFFECDGAFLAEAHRRPLLLRHDGPGQPAHIRGEIMRTPQVEVGENGAPLQDVEEVLGVGFEDGLLADGIEGLVLDGGSPAMAGVVVLGFHDFLHDELSGAGAGGGDARLPVYPRQLQAKGWRLLRFVFGGNEPVGFGLVAGLEASLLLGDEVFAIVGAPPTAEHPVTVLHFTIHVVSMNHPLPPALASSGRV